MTSNVQKHFLSSIRFSGWSLNRQSLQRIAVSSLIGSSFTLAGCQQMGFRARDEELTRMMAEQDDWDLPQSPVSKVPRPNVYDLKTPSRFEKANRLDAEGGNGANDRNAKTKRSGLVGYGPASDHSESDDRTHSTLLSTSNQDIDIDGALASLPAAYREILKKQLDAVQSSESLATNALSKSKSKPSENRAKAEDRLPASRDSVAMSEPSNGAKASGSNKVSFRMTDTSLVEQDNGMRDKVETADAVPSKNNDVSLATAIATSPHYADRSDNLGTNVVQASAIAPLSNSKSIPLLPIPMGNAVQTANASNWRQLLSQAIEQLEKQVKEVPASDENLRISQEVTLRMLYVSQRRLADAMRPIDKLSDNEKDYFQHQMQALYEASNPDAMPVRSRHWSLVMNSQREATNQLAAASNLEVKSVAFCTEVERYGVITKFPKYHFKPDDELLLYCEIENVAANKVKEGFESQLQGSYEIIDSQGRKVADQLLPMEPEICQNHRRDYFIVYKIYMPQQISAGNYQLRLTVEDMKARKFGQSQLEFQIKK